MSLDLRQLESEIYSRLAGDSQLTSLLGGQKVYNTVAPRRASLPVVVFSLASGVEEPETPLRQVRLVYLVKAVADDAEDALTIARRLDELMHQATFQAGGMGTFWCQRDTVVKFMEEGTGGRSLWHAGAQYVIRLSE